MSSKWPLSGAPLGFPETQRYEFVRELGEGGMGVVFEAFDRETASPVALKTLKNLSPDSVLRLKNEFRSLQNIQHRNLVSLLELQVENGHWFFTMELVRPAVDFLNHVRPIEGLAPPSSTSDGVSANTAAVTVPSPSSETLRADTLVDRAGSARTLPRLDVERLRDAFGQLATGLAVLHNAQRIHRDLKPSNVLVTAEGRVVILDFGLITDTALDRRWSDDHIVGTPAYMAPEQGAAKPVGIEADCYSLGVMLYEALTDRLPHEGGSSLEIIARKQQAEPQRPRDVDPSVPADLEQLAMDLLRFDPRLRPSAVEVLQRLGLRQLIPEISASSSLGQHAPFVGRQAELRFLREAFDALRPVREGITLRVHGESGIGKTALVKRFTEQVEADVPGTLILEGRCFERESVPFKGVDGVIDSLSQRLSGLDKTEVHALLPHGTTLLAQVFPILRRIEAIAKASPPATTIRDPQELRKRLFTALRELLAAIARRHRVVIVIDDFQWADTDSRTLIREVMAPPGSPALLLIETVRSDQPSVDRDPLQGGVINLELRSLPQEDAQSLADLLFRRLAGRLSPGPTRASSQLNLAAIGGDAAGHPLFIDELVRHALENTSQELGSIRLDQALRSRTRKLDGTARNIVELTAVASGPLALEMIAQALSIEFGALARHISYLRVHHLVKGQGSRRSDRVEPFHDRVRAAVLDEIETEVKRSHHERLALALEATRRADPEALAFHWKGAGEVAQAAKYTAYAAARAARALAFDRAAALYREALELHAGSAEEVQSLKANLASALANAGRSRDAADVYLEVAAKASPQQAIELRRLAADQLLRCGHIDSGMREIRSVLSSVDLAWPESRGSTIATVALYRARRRLRGLRFREEEESNVPQKVLTRIDTCWSAAIGLSAVDTLRGLLFQTRHLLLALDAGEPYRIARALALECAFTAMGGRSETRKARRLGEQAIELATRIGHPHAIGWATLTSGIASFQSGEWREACRRMEEADAIFRDRCTGVTWERALGLMFWLTALFYRGEVAELVRRTESQRKEAQARGDLFATTNLRLSNMNATWLASDSVETAREQATRAMVEWSIPKSLGYVLQHYYHLLAQANVELYTGRGQQAHDRIAEGWPALKRSVLLRVPYVRIEATHLHARAALAAAESGRGELVQQAERCAAELEGEQIGWAGALAGLVRAAVAATRGQAEVATALLREAAARFDGAGMALYAASARVRLGALSNADQESARGATSWMQGQGIANPSRMCAMLAPGFP